MSKGHLARQGTRRAARQRLRGVDDPLTLMGVISDVWPDEILYEATPFSRCEVAARRVVLSTNLTNYDLPFALAHELGHLFDAERPTHSQRFAFSSVVGRVPSEWLNRAESQYCGDPGEAFASAYAMLSVQGPWRNVLVVTRHWPADHDEEVLRIARAVIQEANRKLLPLATSASACS